MSNSKIKDKLIILSAVLFTLTMVFFTEITENGTKVAIIIWINSIVPVLLPFFIFSSFIKRTGSLKMFPPKIYAFISAFLSGYPIGARIVSDYISEKQLTLKEGKYILSYSLVTGPAFILFTVGEFIGSREGALVVAIAHYAGAFLNSVLYKCPIHKSSKVHKSINSKFFANFTEAIYDGFRSMVVILAYLMFFSILINMAGSAGLWALIDNEIVAAIITGFLEMTVGIKAVGMCLIGMDMRVVLAATLVSFGGLSVIGQSASISGESGLSFTDIFKIKITHGLCAGIVATLIMRFVVL